MADKKRLQILKERNEKFESLISLFEEELLRVYPNSVKDGITETNKKIWKDRPLYQLEDRVKELKKMEPIKEESETKDTTEQ